MELLLYIRERIDMEILYPLGIFVTSMLGLDKAADLIADIAPTYFASIAVLVSAFFGADALRKK